MRLRCSPLVLALGASAPLAAMDLGEVAIHGFASQGYLHSTENNYYGSTTDGSLEFNEIGLNCGVDLTDKLRFGLQLLSRDLGEFGNNRIELDWASADYRWRDWLGVRLGRCKQTIGIYNELQDLDLARIQIFLPTSVYNPGFRDVMVSADGGQVYGDLSLDAIGSLDYQFSIGAMHVPDDGGVAAVVSDTGFLEPSRFDNGTEYGASVVWSTPLHGLRIGGCAVRINDLGAHGTVDLAYVNAMLPPSMRYPAGTEVTFDYGYEHLNVFTLSGEYVWHRLTLAAEYQQFRGDAEIRFNLPAGGPWPPMTLTQDVHMRTEGWYGSTAYEVTDDLTLALTISEYWPDRTDKRGSNLPPGTPRYSAWSQDLYLSARYAILDSWMVKAELHYINGTASVRQAENDDDALARDWLLLALKSTVVF